MTMEVMPTDTPDENADEAPDQERDDIITFLTYNQDICFKNQQRWEPDLTHKEKFDIALNIFQNNKLQFLMKFGKYLKKSHLEYFKQFTDKQEPDYEEIKLVLNDLYKTCSQNSNITIIKNRRYGALQQMIQAESYFSEIEMMKRNPLLYEQLVGQYLTADEVRERDKYEIDDKVTFVKILMEGIERDNAQLYKKKQEETQDGQMEEEDESSDDDDDPGRSSSPKPSTSRWGEFEPDKMYRPKPKNVPARITAQERLLLKQEFVTTMYQSFLDGKDEDFNYDNVDRDTSFDNTVEIDNDAEERYFESEELEEVEMGPESSEDELDIYMNALNQHPAVTKLSNELKKM